MNQLRLIEDRLASRLRRSSWPRHRELAFRAGLEFVRAAVDGREPARWAAAALKPQTRRAK